MLKSKSNTVERSLKQFLLNLSRYPGQRKTHPALHLWQKIKNYSLEFNFFCPYSGLLCFRIKWHDIKAVMIRLCLYLVLLQRGSYFTPTIISSNTHLHQI